MSKINLTPLQKAQAFDRLFNSEDDGPIAKQVGYINKEAAELLSFCEKSDPDFRKNFGVPITKAGVPYKKAFADYYGVTIEKAASDYTTADDEFASVTDWRGTGFMAEQTATKFWNFVLDVADPFMKRITFIMSKKNPTAINMTGMIEENLLSSLRSSDGQPGTNLAKQVARFRKNMLARHIEMQFDLQYEDIVNNLDEPNFVSNVLTPVMIGYGNDILRLLTNGTSYDYSSVTLATAASRSDMYKLLQGWEYKIQNMSGSWTADQVSIVLGAHGKHMTPNKYTIDGTGTVSKWAPTHADTTEYVVPTDSDATLSIAETAQLKVLKGTTGTVCYARKDGIEVLPNKNATLTYSTTNQATASSYVEIYDSSDNLLATSPANTTEALTVHTINFYTRNTNFIYLKLHSVTNSMYTYFSVITLQQEVAAYSGFQIQDIMDQLIKLRRLEHDHLTGYAFIMSKEDIAAYAESKGAPVQITPTGTYVSANNTTREQWRVNGVVPMHRGHEVILNPFKHSISESKSYGGTSIYGSILFAIPTDLMAFGLIGNFPMQPLSTKEFKPRGKHGGAEVEYTKHGWMDSETAPGGRIGIAFQGATCETPVLMQTDSPKAEICVSGTTTSAKGVYAYCDTFGARTFMATTANVANLATLALAIAGVTAGTVFEITEGVVQNAAGNLTDDDWSFRSFKDGILTKGAVKACTFV